MPLPLRKFNLMGLRFMEFMWIVAATTTWFVAKLLPEVQAQG
jgi:hypothetical protein